MAKTSPGAECLEFDRMERAAVITVRMPKKLHAALTELAYQRRKSINLFCVETLVAEIEKAKAEEAKS